MWKCSNYKLTHNEYGYSNSKRLNTAHVIFCDCAVYITLFSSSSPYVLEGVVLGSLMYCWGWRVIVIFDGGLLRDSLERFIGCSLKGSYQCNACNYACQTWICDFSPDSNLIQAKIDLEQGYKFKPNLFSVSFEVEQEQATLREDKSISATPDQLSSALQTFKKKWGKCFKWTEKFWWQKVLLDH